MFRRKKERPWYWRVIAILIALRVLYYFARFFMKVTDKAVGKMEEREIPEGREKMFLRFMKRK